MTTNSESSSARDKLALHHGPIIDNQQRLKSAAIRGATHAFTARPDYQQPKSLHSGTNGARAAALSAGCASRPESTSPPKDSAPALTAPPRSQSASISQVQQLLKGFEQSSTDGTFRTPSLIRGASKRVQSRSPSQVAALIASSRSRSPYRVPLPSRNEPKNNKAVPNTEVHVPNRQVDKTEFLDQSKFLERTQSTSHERTVTTLRPLRPVSTSQSPPATLALEQSRVNESNPTATTLQKRQLQGVSSILAAQAAANTLVPLHGSSRDPPLRESEDGFESEGALSEDSDRGRRSGPRKQILGSDITPLEASHYSRPNELGPKTNGQNLSGRRLTRSVSKPVASLQAPSAPSRQKLSSISAAHYIDERTGLTEISLADAIVASSLASSRAPSPAKKAPVPPPPPRRSSVSRSLFRSRHSSETDLPRHVGPHQGMRQTLRKYPSDETDEENTRHKHKHFIKHPNKHREGSRKRWKEKVTDRERKRYEGVWAANKGLFLTSPLSQSNEEVTLETTASELVLDLVVRDIWSRSRLPTDALAEIWDLLDRQAVGTLTRDEFVLGLWLIDQKLKGRKLPIRISPTLWASVRQAWGVRVPRKS